MRKVTIYIILVTGLLSHSCKNEIVQFLPGGERNSNKWFEPTPYGMVYIPRDSYVVGPSDDEVKDMGNKSKRVSVESFWMDDTEIKNNISHRYLAFNQLSKILNDYWNDIDKSKYRS